MAVTFGIFDGVHLGHRSLVEQLRAEAAVAGLPSLVVTFFPHPTRLFTPQAPKPLLLPLKRRIELLKAAGADCVLVQTFDARFAELSADAFCEEYLGGVLNVGRAVLGYNFSYGKNREGSWDHFSALARRLGWSARLGTAALLDGEAVSSTRVRNAVLAGEAETAARLLGRAFALSGTVVRGNQLGRTIGFPTANIHTENEVLPRCGVYACEVEISGRGVRHAAVMNCGHRPTVAEGLKLQIEAHILDFSEEIYGAGVTYHVRHFIRPERKFSGLSELKDQIAADTARTREYFARNP